MEFRLVTIDGTIVFQGPLWWLHTCLMECYEETGFAKIDQKLSEGSWINREDVWALVCVNPETNDEHFVLAPELTRQFLYTLGTSNPRPYVEPKTRSRFIPKYKV